jgi:2,5-furandicarboxylate decarboxylase 1
MQDVRTFIKKLEKETPKEIVRYREEADPYYEITAIVKKFDLAGKRPLIIFENVKCYHYPVVCNMEATISRLSVALGVPADKVEERYREIENGVLNGTINYPPKEVTPGESPVKEVIISREEVDLYKFPVITHHVGETPYITRGIGVVRDPEKGYLHAAIYRLMVKSKNHMVTHITPGRHLWYIYKKAEAMEQPLPIAFIVGNHPLWSMGAQSRIAHPPTEYDVIGGLLGESLEVVRCENSDLLVPARAEMVIEGELRPHSLEQEGPWSDFTRYSQIAQRHSVFVTGISHRQDMIFHDAGAWVRYGLEFTRIPQETYMLRELQKDIPSIKDFRFAFNPGFMYGIISMKKTHLGEPKQAILSAFANELYLKYVIVVDDDVDIKNKSEVFWSIATRAQAERDFLIIPGSIGTDLDLSAKEEAVVTKVGIDATAKPFCHNMPPIGRVSEEHIEKNDISKYLAKLG